jgi:hypothetical protein
VAVLPAFTPLVLDLDGDGVETTSLAAGVQFDLDADGDADRTGWVGRDDGLLVRDLNGDGQITDGSELFGAATRLPDGRLARDGFEALAALDANGDGVLDSRDPAFAELAVWQDRNADGVSTPDELKTLDDLSIRSLGVAASAQPRVDQGNVVGLASTYQSDQGERELADVWFLAPSAQIDPAAALSDALERYDLGLGSSSGDSDGQSQPAGSTGALYGEEQVEGIMAALSSFSQSGGALERVAGTLPQSSDPLARGLDNDPTRRADPNDPLLAGKA